MNAEEVIDVSDAFNVTAVPYLVLTRNKEVLETVSGSDATKVRAAIEKHAKASPSASSNGAGTTVNTSAAKNLSNYAPTPSEPATAPEHSSSAVAESKEELHDRLSNLVKAAPVMLFMKGTPSSPQCGFSRQLVALLRENSVKYGFFNILADDEVRQGLKEFADWPTFPQLWVEGELVGGLDIVSFTGIRSILLHNLILWQVKEELSTDPDFFKAHSVVKSTGGPATSSQQQTATAA